MVKTVARVVTISILLIIQSASIIGLISSKVFANQDSEVSKHKACEAQQAKRGTDKPSNQDNDDVYFFQVEPYKANFILPAYYSSNPYHAYYGDTDQKGSRILNTEIKFQFSIKFELWRNLFGSNSSIYFGYTQLAFWQAYKSSAFFRENDFQPEVFFRFHSNLRFFGFQLTDIDTGFMHQSNGIGGDNERSWNRIFINQGFKRGDWKINIQLWTVFNIWRNYNNNIESYLGYGDFLISRTFGKQRVDLYLRNQLESNFSRGAEMLTWSYLLKDNTHIYIQAFSGYGQSLGEYNHYTNAFGLGISFGSW